MGVIPNIFDLSNDELKKIMDGNPPHSTSYKMSFDVLHLRHTEEIVRETKELTRQTWMVAFATWALVIANVGLVIVTFGVSIFGFK